MYRIHTCLNDPHSRLVALQCKSDGAQEPERCKMVENVHYYFVSVDAQLFLWVAVFVDARG